MMTAMMKAMMGAMMANNLIQPHYRPSLSLPTNIYSIVILVFLLLIPIPFLKKPPGKNTPHQNPL